MQLPNRSIVVVIDDDNRELLKALMKAFSTVTLVKMGMSPEDYPESVKACHFNHSTTDHSVGFRILNDKLHGFGAVSNTQLELLRRNETIEEADLTTFIQAIAPDWATQLIHIPAADTYLWATQDMLKHYPIDATCKCEIHDDPRLKEALDAMPTTAYVTVATWEVADEESSDTLVVNAIIDVGTRIVANVPGIGEREGNITVLDEESGTIYFDSDDGGSYTIAPEDLNLAKTFPEEIKAAYEQAGVKKGELKVKANSMRDSLIQEVSQADPELRKEFLQFLNNFSENAGESMHPAADIIAEKTSELINNINKAVESHASVKEREFTEYEHYAIQCCIKLIENDPNIDPEEKAEIVRELLETSPSQVETDPNLEFVKDLAILFENGTLTYNG